MATAAVTEFDIPAQPAPAALDLFIHQSGAQVVYLLPDVKDVQTNEVKGAYEPAVALTLLLKDTGLSGAERSPGQFSVGRLAPKAGSVRGSLTLPSGDAAVGVIVTVWETTQSARTDRDGEFFFNGIAPGTYRLVTKADGFQPLHITEVAVKENREITLSRLTLRAADEVTKLQPVTVQAESVEKLDPYAVEGRRETPFSAGNMDLPRSINDVQPYYVFDGRELMTSGASTVDDFLRRNLTMNLQPSTNVQMAAGNVVGNASTIDLRGLGTNRTLVLINGRQLVGSATIGGSGQTDINNLSMGEIERIEVLPSSASGIYGGGALGGVINVILKKNFTGREIDLRYETPGDTDAPTWWAALRYGGEFAGGRGHYKFSVREYGGSSLHLADRLDLWQGYFDRVVSNSPSFIYGTTSPWLGSLANVISASTTVPLTLDNGVSLGSRTTYVPAGTSATTPLATLYSDLQANAGQWNLVPPVIAAGPSGLLQRIYAAPSTRSFAADLSWDESPGLEFRANFSYAKNEASGDRAPISSTFNVAANSPINPFTTAVRVAVPIDFRTPSRYGTITRNLTLGALLHLPGDWEGAIDFAHADSTLRSDTPSADTAAITAALNAGTLNPFVDALRYPLNLDPFVIASESGSITSVNHFNLQATGLLPALPWGAPRLAASAGYRVESNHDGWARQIYPSTPKSSFERTYFPGHLSSAHANSELQLPLVAPRRFPLIDTLVAQIGGRLERTSVNTGTTSRSYFPATGTTTYGGTTLDGEPYFMSTAYKSANYVVGLKYQPVAEIILRGSVSTAFVPPTAANLLDNPKLSNVSIIDPKNNSTYSVPVDGGGNPDLKPENSIARDLGLVWAPKRWKLEGLRIGVQWQKTTIFDRSTALSAQNILNAESTFPDRVQRDAAGLVTLIDASMINLFREDLETLDFTLDYDCQTSFGTFGIQFTETYTPHRITQYALNTPGYEGSGFDPGEIGGGTKTRRNFRFDWRRHAWEASWSVAYWGSTKVYGAKGGPLSVRSLGGAASPIYILPQGGDEVGSALYHDASLGYSFAHRSPGPVGSRWRDRFAARLLADATIQVGVNNVFNRYPSFSAFNYSSNYISSPHGDLRLRTVWLRLRKGF